MTTGTYERRAARRWQRELGIYYCEALTFVRHNVAAKTHSERTRQLVDWSRSRAAPLGVHPYAPEYALIRDVPSAVNFLLQGLIRDFVPDTARVAELLPTIDAMVADLHVLRIPDRLTRQVQRQWWETHPALEAFAGNLPILVETINRAMDLLLNRSPLPTQELAALADRHVRLLTSATRAAEDLGIDLMEIVRNELPSRDLHAPLTPWLFVDRSVATMWHCSSRLEHEISQVLGEDRYVPRRTMRSLPCDDDALWF